MWLELLACATQHSTFLPASHTWFLPFQGKTVAKLASATLPERGSDRPPDQLAKKCHFTAAREIWRHARKVVGEDVQRIDVDENVALLVHQKPRTINYIAALSLIPVTMMVKSEASHGMCRH